MSKEDFSFLLFGGPFAQARIIQTRGKGLRYRKEIRLLEEQCPCGPGEC